MNKRVWPGLLLAASAGVRQAQACAVCFGAGKGNEGIINGLTWGIIVLLGATALLLGSLILAVWRMEIHKRAHDAP